MDMQEPPAPPRLAGAVVFRRCCCRKQCR